MLLLFTCWIVTHRNQRNHWQNCQQTKTDMVKLIVEIDSSKLHWLAQVATYWHWSCGHNTGTGDVGTAQKGGSVPHRLQRTTVCCSLLDVLLVLAPSLVLTQQHREGLQMNLF